jgi:hypothetical protein
MCIDYMESKEWTWSYASSETQIMQGMCSSVTHGIMQGILHVKLTSIYNYIYKTAETLLQ